MKLTQRISKQSFAFGMIVLLPAYLVFGSLIVSAFIQFVFSSLHLEASTNEMNGYLNFVFDLSFVIISFLVFRKEIVKQWNDIKQSYLFKTINNIVIAVPIMYIANIAGSLLSAGITGELSTSQNQLLIESLMKELPVLMIVAVTVLAPILEEFIFRLLLFTGFYKYGRWVAYLASAGLFGLLHVFQPIIQGNINEIVMVFPYLFMGIALCYIYERSDNIFIPVIAHGLMNTISVLLIML